MQISIKIQTTHNNRTTSKTNSWRNFRIQTKLKASLTPQEQRAQTPQKINTPADLQPTMTSAISSENNL